MKKRIAALLVVVLIILSACGANKYMIKDTSEYNTVTKMILGDWKVKTFLSGDENMMDTVYKMGGEASLSFTDRSIKFAFHVDKALVDERSKDWLDQWPSIVVNDYRVTVTGTWSVDEVSGDPTFWFGDKPMVDLELDGSGENFESFWAWEKTKFAATAATAQSDFGGGLAGLAMNKMATSAMKKATKTSFYPKMPSSALGYDIQLSADKSNLKLMRKNKVIWEFER